MGKSLLICENLAGVASTASTTTYWKTAGYLFSQTAETSQDIKFRTAGTLSKFYCRVITNTAAANTIRTRKNGANGGQSVSITSSGTGIFEDTTNTDTIASTDLICIQYAQTTTGVTTFTIMSTVFDATTDTVTIDVNGNTITGLSGSGITYYLPIGGRIAAITSETNQKCRIRKAGTFKNLGVFLSSNSRVTSTVWTSRKNGADGNLTLTFAAGGTGWQEDTTHSDSVAAGDDYNIKIANGVTDANTYNFKTQKLEYVSTAGDGHQYCSATTVAVADATTVFFQVGGDNVSTTTETNSRVKTRVALTANEMVFFVTANTINASSTVTSRDNGVDGNLTITVTTTATGLFADSTNSDSLAATDDFSIQYAAASVAGSQTTTISWFGVNFNNVAGTLFTRPLSTETITISEVSLARLYGANRTGTDSPAISEAIARVATNTRALSTETNTIGETLARVYGVVRPITTETITIGETLARLLAAIRAPTAETITIGEAIAKVQVLVRALSTETVTVGESLARVLSKIKALSDTVVIGEALTRAFVGVRSLATETNTIGESLARLKAATRALSTETTTISENLARQFGLVRALATETTAVSESLTRIYNAIRSLSDSPAISESLAKVQVLVRSLSVQTTTIGESLARLLGINRTLSDTTVIGESLNRILAATRTLATQTTTISEALTRVFGSVRSLSPETTSISESLQRLLAAIRSLSDTSTISESLSKVYTPVGGGFFDRPIATETVTIAENLVRAITNVRSLSVETTTIGETLSRLIAVIRSLLDTTTIAGGTLSRLYGATRSLSDTNTISDSLSRVLALVKSLADSTILTESLTRLQVLTRTLTTEITTVSDSLVATAGLNLHRLLSDTITVTDSVSQFFSSGDFIKTLTENVAISEVLKALHGGIIIPLSKLPTQATSRRPLEGVGAKNRAHERETEHYLRKQVDRFFSVLGRRRYGTGRTRGG